MTGKQKKRWRSVATTSTIVIGMTGLIFVLVEGASSTLLFLRAVMAAATPASETKHAEYDAALGWINLPNVRNDDMYGEGVYLSTNSRRFRGSEDVDSIRPPGKVRAICSGDSFTLGFGVDDDHTWCKLLENEVPGMQTVNMGQGGYGFDQAFLWYDRDGRKIEHDVIVSAFVTYDFRRMMRADFLGYGKPLLRIDGDSLVVSNEPVAGYSFFSSWMARAAPIVRELGTVRLGEQVASRLFPGGGSSDDGVMLSDEETQAIIWRIVEQMVESSRTTERVLLFVHLPVHNDYFDNASPDRWRGRFRNYADSTGVHFLDLIEPYRQLSLSEADEMFFSFDSPGQGHFSVAGNEWAARKIAEFMATLPEFQNRMATLVRAP